MEVPAPVASGDSQYDENLGDNNLSDISGRLLLLKDCRGGGLFSTAKGVDILHFGQRFAPVHIGKQLGLASPCSTESFKPRRDIVA